LHFNVLGPAWLPFPLDDMKSQVAILCAMLALVCQTGIQAAGASGQVSIRTNFVADAVLRPEELAAVVGLAESCGVGQVASVESFHYLPSTSRGILVTSLERTNGRKVSFDTVEVFREGWAYKSKPADPAKTRSSGQFWVEAQRSPTAHELTTFSTPRGTIRVELGSGVPIDVADGIVRAFTTGRIRYSDEFIPRRSKGADFMRPNWLRKSDEGNLYEASFSGSLNRYQFTLVGDEVRIVSVIYVRV
jgi:hypothetical protein